MIKKITLISAVILATLNIHALDVAIDQPGTLHSLVSSPGTTSSLTLTGTINAVDLYYVSTEMPSLKSLDLSRCRIAAHSGTLKGLDADKFAAGEIPASMFAASPIEKIRFSQLENTTIGKLAFFGSQIESLELDSHIARVGEGAFGSCRALTDIKIEKVKEIGKYAFVDCAALADAYLQDVETIDDFAFSRCAKLSKVSSDEQLKVISKGAFAGCKSLQNFDFGTKLVEIGELAFASTDLRSVNLYTCKNLRTIGEFAFANCSQLQEVIFPEKLETLDQGVLFGDPAIRSLQLPDGMKEMDDYALTGLGSVDVVTLPASLEYIGTLAMGGMEGLTHIIVNELDDVPELGEDVWDKIDKSRIQLIVPDELASDFRAASQWQDFDIVENSNSGTTDTSITLESAIRGRLTGSELEIESTGSQIEEVRIYTPGGQLLLHRKYNQNHVVIDCSPFNDKLLIVLVTTNDQKRSVLKLAKNG